MKSIIQIIITFVCIIPSFCLILGLIRWIIAKHDAKNVDSARVQIIASLVSLLPLEVIALLIFFLFPSQSKDVLSLSLLLANLLEPLLISMVLIVVPFLLWILSTSISWRLQLRQKRTNKQFDVFLCYSEEDRTEVRQLARQLNKEGIFPWVGEREVGSGQPWQSVLERELVQIKAAVACVGKSGINPWQQKDLEAFLRKFVARQLPVIPVLLPGASQKPPLPLFLEGVRWVDCRSLTSSFISELRKGIEGDAIYKPLLSTSPQAQVRSDVTEIRKAINDYSYDQYQQLSEAIIRLLWATDPILIVSSHFKSGTVQEIRLPTLGLQFETNKALFFLRVSNLSHSSYKHLSEIGSAREADLIFVVDFLERIPSPPTDDPRVVWIRPDRLLEIICTPLDEIKAWLGRLIASELKYFDVLIPYRTRGTADLFYGREHELEQLMSSSVRGGIIIGAHGSGKTSLLDQLGERLKNRQNYVISGRYTYHSTHFQPFFEDTLHSLDLDAPTNLTPETWAYRLRTCSRAGKCPVFLLDEVDELLEQDAESGFHLGREMRALQYDGYCKFYLAGHALLREAIELEGGPFRNFAQEIILKGLEKSAGLQLIQEPMGAIGFRVSTEQASRIYEGTGGVAILIQEFCKHLLLHICRERKATVADTAIEKIEKDPSYLNFVFEHYEYAQTWDSMAVMLITAHFGQASRKDILDTLTAYSIKLTQDQLEKPLKFLIRFGILDEFEAGLYRVLSTYQCKAIEARTYSSDALLISQLEKGKKG